MATKTLTPLSKVLLLFSTAVTNVKNMSKNMSRRCLTGLPKTDRTIERPNDRTIERPTIFKTVQKVPANTPSFYALPLSTNVLLNSFAAQLINAPFKCTTEQSHCLTPKHFMQ